MLKILFVAVILVVFAFLGLGIRLIFDKDAELTLHSCAGKNKELDDVDGCTCCGIRNRKTIKNQKL